MKLDGCTVIVHTQDPIEPGNWAVVTDETQITNVEVYLHEVTIRIPANDGTTRETAAVEFGLPL